MIKFRIPINDTDETIVAPSVVSIVNRLKQVFHIDKYAKISLENSESPYINDNWSVGDTTNSSNSNAQTSIDVSYSVTYDEANIKTTDVRRNRSKPILYSDETKFKVSVLYIASKLTLTLKIKSKSKNRLATILSDLRVRAISNREVVQHDLVYYYYLQNFFKSLISNFNYNKNTAYGRIGTDDCVSNEEYLSGLIDDRFTLLGDMSGSLSRTALGFKEVQRGALGRFTGDMVNNKKTYVKEEGVWETDIEYEVLFKQPMYYDVEYYQIAYQYRLDESFTQMFSTESKPEGYYSKYDNMLSKFNNGNYMKKCLLNLNDKYEYLRIPEDDFDSNIPFMIYYTRLLSVNVTLTSNSDILFNVRDIPGFTFADEILTMLEETEGVLAHNIFNSCFYIQLYNFEEQMNDGVVYMDDALNVKLSEDLDKSGIYRVVFSVVTDLSVLMPVARERLKSKYGEFMSDLTDLGTSLYFTGFTLNDRGQTYYAQRSNIIGRFMKENK